MVALIPGVNGFPRHFDVDDICPDYRYILILIILAPSACTFWVHAFSYLVYFLDAIIYLVLDKDSNRCTNVHTYIGILP